MSAENKIRRIESIYKSSPFSLAGYTVNVFFNRIGFSLADFGGVNEQVENETLNSDSLSLITPLFQRDLGRWSLSMKAKFVENILLGAPTNIILYTLKPDQQDCKILDGQHRCNAIFEFIENKFPIFGDVLYSDIEDHWIVRRGFRTTITVHTFSNELEAIDFYIKINDGITHTPEDITKAKVYFDTISKD